jgi:hypothetical protein
MCLMVMAMNNVDPDILAALKSIAADADTPRVLQARKRHDAATQRRFETELSLMSDEVEKLVPRSHPLFELVLILAVARKVERKHAQQEPEYIPDFERGFPAGW